MGTIVPTTANDEDSLSLSEYTDNEKSAPTELLAEFLTSIMKKDYVNALKYCKLSKVSLSEVVMPSRHQRNFSSVLDFEPNNKTAKDFYPQLVEKVNEQLSTSSDGSDENCNYTSSLEFVDNEILDNDNISQSSSITSSISSNEDDDGSELNSISEEIDRRDQEDLINSLSHSSSQGSNLSKSDQLPESMSSTSSNNVENTSNSFSFTSLLLDDSEDINNNNNADPPAEPVVAPSQNPSSPFTSKIMQMFKGKWDASPSKHN